MSFLGRLFGPPNIDELKLNRNIRGLVKSLGYQRDSLVPKAAAAALVEIGSPAVNTLIETFENEYSSERRAVAEILGEIGDAKAVGPLIEALTYRHQYEQLQTGVVRDRNKHVDMAAIEALGSIGDGRAIEVLEKTLADSDVDVRRQAGLALTQLGFESELSIKAVSEPATKEAIPPADGPLLQRLREVDAGPSRQQRVQSSEILGVLGTILRWVSMALIVPVLFFEVAGEYLILSILAVSAIGLIGVALEASGKQKSFRNLIDESEHEIVDAASATSSSLSKTSARQRFLIGGLIGGTIAVLLRLFYLDVVGFIAISVIGFVLGVFMQEFVLRIRLGWWGMPDWAIFLVIPLVFTGLVLVAYYEGFYTSALGPYVTPVVSFAAGGVLGGYITLAIFGTRASWKLRRARKLYDESKYTESLSKLEEVFEAGDKVAIAHNNRGVVRYTMGDIPAALEDLDRAVEMVPGQAAYFWNRGLAQKAASNDRAAPEDFRSVLVVTQLAENSPLPKTGKYLTDLQAVDLLIDRESERVRSGVWQGLASLHFDSLGTLNESGDLMLATEVSQDSEKHQVLRSVDSFFPLAQGNRWVYRSAISETTTVFSRAELRNSLKGDFVRTFLDLEADDMEEEYTLGQKVTRGGRDYWEVQVNDPMARDGRYRSPWKKDGKVSEVLWGTSRIHSKSHPYLHTAEERIIELDGSERVHRLFDEFAPPLHLSGIGIVSFHDDGEAIVYRNAQLVTISVPAGEFDDCLHITVEALPSARYGDLPVRQGWSSDSFYAPGVGLVKETQRDHAGNTTYELQLLSYEFPQVKDLG